MSRMVIAVMAVLVSLPAAVSAKERILLSGSLSGELLPGEYQVSSVIAVRRGETLKICAGAALYFEQLAGITVFGELLIEGAPDNPVVLASVNDAGGPVEAFDWNGIEVEGPFAAVRMRHVSIANSVYGVNVKEFGAKADLAEVTFKNNGYASVMIGGQEIPIAAGKPASVLWDMGPRPPQAALSTGGLNGGKPEYKSKKRLAFCAGSIGVAATGMVLSGVNLARTHNDARRCEQEDDPHQTSLLKESIRRSTTMSNIGAAITGAGLACVGMAVFF